ncbi:MAG: hypothetical protein V8K32_03300 [Candidatus Electrothrix gigas]
MPTIQWRPQVNAITTPISYRNEDLVRSLAPLIMKWIQDRMINGDLVVQRLSS